METSEKKPRFLAKKLGKGVLALVVVLAVLVLGGVLTVVAYKVKPSLFARWIGAPSQNAAAQKDAQNLVDEVGKYIDLPGDETPTIATVSDAEKLKGQAFFAKAQNGDKVMFYTKAKKAFLYRPSTKKIIDVAPLSVGQNPTDTASGSATPQATPAPAKVSLLNGSAVTGLTTTAERKLKTVAGIVVSGKGNAKSTTYTKTTVINVKNVKADLVAKVATAVGGTVDSLPAGETAPVDADIVVILAP